VLDGAFVIRTYNALGGTGPDAVRHMLSEFTRQADAFAAGIAADKKRLDDARALILRIAETGDLSLAA
jgi:hypothetical protein